MYVTTTEKCKKLVDKNISLTNLQIEKEEENMLRERLEMMTLQITQEMEEEFNKEKSKIELLGRKLNEDDDTKIQMFFRKIKGTDDVDETGQKEEMNIVIKELRELNEDDSPENETNKLMS